MSPSADVVAPVPEADRSAALELTQATLVQAGITPKDRVVVALNSDGDLAGAHLAEAAANVAAAAAAVGPRGRMRLLAALEAVRATVLVATPTGAADFLARLHMEFLADPLDLELRTIVLVGEISDLRTYRHTASEFGARVQQVYVDPVLGVAVASRDATDSSAPLELVRPNLVSLAALGENRTVEVPGGSGLTEVVLTPGWHSALGAMTVRTGEVVQLDTEAKGIPAPAHTVGGHILVRGRWIPLTPLRAALSKIDGIARWELQVRREGTLDAATLQVTFSRETLVKNPMWHGRIEQALTAITPVAIAVEVSSEVSETTSPPTVTDARGQHLGQDRSRL